MAIRTAVDQFRFAFAVRKFLAQERARKAKHTYRAEYHFPLLIHFTICLQELGGFRSSIANMVNRNIDEVFFSGW